MFSGIVEEYAEVVRIVKDLENLHLTLKCSFVDELKIDQSVSHNGVCLTVVSIQDGTYTVTAMKETIERSNIGLLKEGDKVNVERSMMMNGRLDGHIVQGHVDQTAECVSIQDAEGSWYFTFKYKFDKVGLSTGGNLMLAGTYTGNPNGSAFQPKDADGNALTLYGNHTINDIFANTQDDNWHIAVIDLTHGGNSTLFTADANGDYVAKYVYLRFTEVSGTDSELNGVHSLFRHS